MFKKARNPSDSPKTIPSPRVSPIISNFHESQASWIHSGKIKLLGLRNDVMGAADGWELRGVEWCVITPYFACEMIAHKFCGVCHGCGPSQAIAKSSNSGQVVALKSES
jgi:hypothetical protein